MGLDMYLYKRYYIGKKGGVSISINGEHLDIVLDGIDYIDAPETIYWRKANMIHKWFVENCQEGTDDCKPYYVSSEQLHELLDTCLKVRDCPETAKVLLPTQPGFFFGDIEYDEYYFKDIEYTIKELSKLNLMGEDYSFSFYYQSSW